MKIETIRSVKATLNRVVRELPETGSVIITKDGRPCAVLMLVSEETDLEVVALSQNRGFWRQIDRAAERAEKLGWAPLEEEPRGKARRSVRSRAR
jgi:antitoxin (DNA-binding transcriptional repressor) of toxin-antitoxin stability system